MTHLERGILFLPYCYSERIIYDDRACHNFEEMLHESCTEKGDSTVFKRLGKMDMLVDKLQFTNHVDRQCKPNCNPHDRNELHGVSVCLSVCPSVYRYRLAFCGGVVGG